jgi:hypothetical protein
MERRQTLVSLLTTSVSATDGVALRAKAAASHASAGATAAWTVSTVAARLLQEAYRVGGVLSSHSERHKSIATLLAFVSCAQVSLPCVRTRLGSCAFLTRVAS